MATRASNGAAIKAIREAVGVTQQDFAKRVGVNPSTLSNIESGTYRASPALARRIADELGVPLDAVTTVITEAVA